LDAFESSETFCIHKLDLQHDLNELFRGLHKSSTQRKIRRAEREGLTYEEGRSDALLDQFYNLLELTRRRHHLPPQPRKWFSILATCMGDQLKIRVASSQRTPVASILTLRFKTTLMYKYGCADERFFRLGGMQMLLWQAIEEAKESRLKEFDLGRSEANDQGLILFKDRLGAKRAPLSYFRHPTGLRHVPLTSRPAQQGRRFLSYVPSHILNAGGKLLYKHFG
jgi:lipid II:glycine glycyltransferase (peptidoglycan interpeptide bridge formation enzyme)